MRAGFEVPPRHLIAGVPGKVVRELTPAELAWKSAGTATYQRLAVRCRESLQEVMPLASADFARPRLGSEVLAPLKQSR